MRVTQAEVAKAIGYLDKIYGGLMPKGGGREMVDAWLLGMKDLDAEEGDFLAAVQTWIGREDSVYSPKPGPIMAIIRQQQADRKRTQELASWRANGRLCCTNGVYFHADTGEECDEHGNPLPELPAAKKTHGELDAMMDRIAKNIPKTTTDIVKKPRS